MSSEDDPVLQRLDDLTGRLERVEKRLERLERAPPSAVTESRAEPEEAPEALVTAGTVPLIGRTLLVLGGAFLLRALTEAGILPQAMGSFLGLAYAIVWLLIADRVAARERMGDATFHGLATALIAFPLLWESTVEFQFLEPAASAGALLVTAAAGLVVAWRRRLAALAWIVVGGAAPTAVALAFATRTPTAFLAALLVLALAALWLGYLKGWGGLAWSVAALVNLVFLFVTILVLTNPDAALLGDLAPMHWVALLAVMAAVYLGSLAVRTVYWHREVGYLETGQALTTFVLAVGGATSIATLHGVDRILTGTPVLILAAACYATAFGVIARRPGQVRTLHFYEASALVLTLVGVPLLLTRTPASMLFAAGGIACSALGWRSSRTILSLHGAALLAAGAIGSGLLSTVLDAFVGPAASLANWSSLPVIGVLLAIAFSTVLPLSRHSAQDPLSARIAGALLAALFILGVAGLVVTSAGVWLPRTEGGEVGAPALATLRTGVLAVAAVGLVGLGRRTRWADLAWLAYGLVTLGAVKLLLEDIRVGHAASLFPSLVLYGGGLILVSRLATRLHHSRRTPSNS